MKICPINIPNLAYLNPLIEVKSAYADLLYVQALFKENKDHRQFIPVTFAFAAETKEFFRLHPINDCIVIERLTISEKDFQDLYNLYYRWFIWLDPVSYQSYEPDEFEQYKAAWSKIFAFFIGPFEQYLDQNIGITLLISILPVNGRKYVFDFATIYDLTYRFSPRPQNINAYVLSVAGMNIIEFSKNLTKIIKPCYSKTVLLYGFQEHYSEEALLSAPDTVRAMALARESIYEKVLAAAVEAGVKVVSLERTEHLLEYMKREWAAYMIQIVAHYESTTDDKRLFFKKRSIDFDGLLSEIQEMKENAELRDDILIDAVTCENFFDFQALYASGLRYMNMSHHKMDTDQIAFVLYELYTGINAESIGWNPRYLIGENYLHEARSNIMRCFFKISAGPNQVLTP